MRASSKGPASLRGEALLGWIAENAPSARDSAIERHLGIEARAADAASPGDDLIGYHASGVAPIVGALREIALAPGDVVIDLGAGLGKVVLLVHLLTGVAARGVEIQAALVLRARAAAARSGADVRFDEGDARTAAIDDGTIFFLYLPFTGVALRDVLSRLRAVAAHHAIVVCTLGLDLTREASWLARRRVDSFWLDVYDSRVAGVSSRAAGGHPLAGPLADAIASER